VWASTSGATLLTSEPTPSALPFTAPPFTHFVTVLLTACLMLCPTMSPQLLGGALLVVTVLRAAALFRVHRRMQEAHQRYHDIELSDWLMGIVLPAACYLALIGTGGAFVAGWSVSFNSLAIAIVAILLLGVFGAWELMLWLAMTRLRKGASGSP